ncbi:MAG: DNA polymerase III subunit chi [Methylobacteriaceae bacterium]|nr:DNA polymerase III subunit chi [Methylobacteriaceae bacterium]
MTEVHFYHLRGQRLERVLPLLLERSLQRGWRCAVQMASEERMTAVDEALWTYADESFLAHGTPREGDADLQPVYLTTATDNPNGAAVRMFLEGTEALPVLQRSDAAAYQRAMVIFDGADADQLAGARAQWAALKSAGHDVTYWQQDEDGRWEKKA